MINYMENNTSLVAVVLLCYKRYTMFFNLVVFHFVCLYIFVCEQEAAHKGITRLLRVDAVDTERERHSVGYKHLLKEEEWDGWRRRVLLKGMLPIGTYNPVSDAVCTVPEWVGVNWAWQSHGTCLTKQVSRHSHTEATSHPVTEGQECSLWELWM